MKLHPAPLAAELSKVAASPCGLPRGVRHHQTRRVVELRQQQSQDTTISKLSSAVAKALEEPDGRRYSAIAELVTAMGGEIVIRWKDYKEVKV